MLSESRIVLIGQKMHCRRGGDGDLQGDEGEDVEEKGYLCNGINRSYMDF